MSNKLAMVKNLAIVALGSYIESAIGLIAGILIARTLGPTEYGHYAYAIWTAGVLINVINSALTTSSIKFLAELRGAGKVDLAHILIFKLLRWQSWAGALVLCGFAIYSWFYPSVKDTQTLSIMVALTALGAWARAGFWLRGSISKGFEMFTLENITLALTALLNLVSTLVLAWMNVGVVAFFANYAVLGLISNLLIRWMLHRKQLAATPGELPGPLYTRVRKHLVLTGILIIFSTLSSRAVEMTLLKQVADTTAIAYFAIAGSLSKGALDILAGGLSTVLLPGMARRYGEGGSRALQGMLAESTRLYWFIGLIVAGLGLTVADGLIHVLYGTKYVGAITALDWQLVVSGLTLVNAAAFAALTTDDRQLARIGVVATAFVFNIGVGYALIPSKGLEGAIMSAALTQCCSTLLVWAYTLRTTGVKLHWHHMSRLLIAALASTAVTWPLSGELPVKWGFIPSGFLFMMLFLSLSVLLKAWKQSDFEIFAALAGKIRPALAARVLAMGQRFGTKSDGQI